MAINIQELFNLLVKSLLWWIRTFKMSLLSLKELFRPMKFATRINSTGHLEKKDQLVDKTGIAYFSVGDRVETTTKEQGRVVMRYRSVKTNEIVGCTIIWDDEYRGNKFSILLSAVDLGEKFNPIIRKVKYV